MRRRNEEVTWPRTGLGVMRIAHKESLKRTAAHRRRMIAIVDFGLSGHAPYCRISAASRRASNDEVLSIPGVDVDRVNRG